MFNEEKTTQLAVHILNRKGGRMPYIKLIKLMYLCDRESIRRHNRAITGDRYVAMRFGPVLSTTLNLIRSGYDDLTVPPELTESGNGREPTLWIKAIRTEGHDVVVALAKSIGELTDEEKDTIKPVLDQFINYDPWDLVHYTHKNCLEWKDPAPNSVQDISILFIGRALGKSEEEISQLAFGP